jgi:hypothetical protein
LTPSLESIEEISAITPGTSEFLKTIIFPFGLKSNLKPFIPTMRCSSSPKTVPLTLVTPFSVVSFTVILFL